MQRKERVRTLGSYGERLVASYFKSNGATVTLSEDWFDDQKDMIINGMTTEVKTLMPIYKYNAFCLPAQQRLKCESVDKLIFVKIPAQRTDPVHIYESHKDKDTNRRYDFSEYFNGMHCIFYRLTFLEKLVTIHNNQVSSYLWDMSPSEYKGCFNETRIYRGS